MNRAKHPLPALQGQIERPAGRTRFGRNGLFCRAIRGQAGYPTGALNEQRAVGFEP